VAIKRTGLKPSLNFLWVLEGALTNADWRQVTNDDRLFLASQVEFLESGQAGHLYRSGKHSSKNASNGRFSNI